MSSTRNYFVPKAVSAAASGRAAPDSLALTAVRAAAHGKVRGYHLPLLASGTWSGATWAATVLEKERAAMDRRAEALLAAAGYDDRYVYQGVLDGSYPDHELVVSVARQEGYDSPLERWDGMDWGVVEEDPDGLEYVVLDRDVLIDVLDAIDSGSAGVMLRPFEPKAWVRDCEVQDYPVLAAAGPPRNTGVMVALRITGDAAEQLSLEDEGGVPTDDLHVTLAYLGDMEEDAIDYQAVHHAVATWVRRVGEMTGEVSGPAQFTAAEEPVSVALVDIPALPEARQLLVRLLEANGVEVRKDHGYTPHITLAYGPDYEGLDVPNVPLDFEYCTVHYGDDIQEYPFGQPVVAAGGAGPDLIYAIVDEFDTNAVLDIVRVIPGPVAYRRSGGKWVKDNPILMRLMGVDPPPVVQVPAEQAEDVIAQVDAYDKENPEPVAAAAWDESKFKRDHGKFAKKEGGSSSASKPPRGPVRPGGAKKGPKQALSRPNSPKPGSRPFAGPKLHSRFTADQLQKQPWRLLSIGGDKDRSTLDLGLGDEFWAKQPEGFREFARDFLIKKRREAGSDGGGKKEDTESSDDGLNEKGERKGEKGDGKRDVAKGDQRSQAQVEAQKKAAAKGGEKQGAANLAAWMKDVPPKYKKAMRELVMAASAKWGGGKGDGSGSGSSAGRSGSSRGSSTGSESSGGSKGSRAGDPNLADSSSNPNSVGNSAEDRIRKLDKADRDFDLGFAKEGLGEARRREIFDRQVAGAAERLLKTDANPRAIQRVLRHKVMEEKRRRDQFERQRKLKAEQERVRRMAARNRESDLQAREGITADASMMPGKLKKYWIAGEGAAKIRWGTSGDFNRCTRALAKYLNPGQVKGACANLHHLATGKYPGKGRGH